MDREQLLSQWREEAARGMSGWDFSHIQGRCTVETLPWDYPQVVREFLRPGVRLLDMGTGGGELLLTLDDSFDLVIDRHESYDLSEVRRVLKKNGFFVTQQVGGENDLPLVKRLCQGFSGSFVGFNLENELPRFRQAGFRVMRSDQAYVESRYLDVGAVVFQASVCPWEYPGFSVETSQEALFQMQAQVESLGFVPNLEHRFLIVAKNRK